MKSKKIRIITEARNQFDHIVPCGVKKRLLDCFTLHRNKLLFWFNTTDGSTHVIAKHLATC